MNNRPDQQNPPLASQKESVAPTSEPVAAGSNRFQQNRHGWKALPAKAVIFPVRMYQRFISPLLGPWCRFTPTCSSYFIQAVEKHGVIRGSLKGIWRICRCHPFGGSGHDPP